MKSVPLRLAKGARVDRLARFGPVHQALEDVLARCDVSQRIKNDPVEFVHRYTDERDVELVALLASSMAFGNVTALRAKIQEVLTRLGSHPSRAADCTEVQRTLAGIRHRIYGEEELARLVVAVVEVQAKFGTLGAYLGNTLRASQGDLRRTLGRLVETLRTSSGLDRMTSRGARHILPDPEGASGCKRLLLFLRWMVRGPDGVDLGLFARHGIPKSALLVPLDVHVHRLAYNLGLTQRVNCAWATTVEVTGHLARFDSEDPVRFDFALCHFGMIGQCPSARTPQICGNCPVQRVCRHWG